MLKEATRHPLSGTSQRLTAAYKWKTISRKYGRSSELEATREILNLLDLAVAESSSLEVLAGRLSGDETFRQAEGAASDAAVLAILARDLPLAVALLEQGRSTIFTQLGRYRSAADEVGAMSPEFATRFAELSVQMDALMLQERRNQSNSDTAAQSFEDAGSR